MPVTFTVRAIVFFGNKLILLISIFVNVSRFIYGCYMPGKERRSGVQRM